MPGINLVLAMGPAEINTHFGDCARLPTNGQESRLQRDAYPALCQWQNCRAVDGSKPVEPVSTVGVDSAPAVTLTSHPRISGIAHVLKSGGRWADVPPDYGPRKTLYNRYVRWGAKGVWIDLFHALAQAGAQVLIDSSAVKAHPASSGKGGRKIKPSAARAAGAHENPRLDRRAVPTALLQAHWRPGR
jgi:transposase